MAPDKFLGRIVLGAEVYQEGNYRVWPSKILDRNYNFVNANPNTIFQFTLYEPASRNKKAYFKAVEYLSSSDRRYPSYYTMYLYENLIIPVDETFFGPPEQTPGVPEISWLASVGN